MVNEFYRQSAHLVGGVLIAVLAASVSQDTFLWIIGLLIACGIIALSLMVRQIRWILKNLERDHVAFRGKGGIFFGVGIWLVAALFWEQAPMAILLLAVPDSLATIIGSNFKSAALPYNHRKTVVGSLVFFVSAALVLAVKYQSAAIFFIAFLLTALESFDYREIPFLDDNLVLPLVGGYLLTYL